MVAVRRTQAGRTQAERTAKTQAALLEATVESLLEVGYSGTTTVEVTRRAGVSLGALLHHYPSKADLLTAAVAHICQVRLEDYRKAMADLAPGTDRVDAALDLLWSMVSGPTFAVWTELWVAARTDPDLARSVVAMDQRFVDDARLIFAELFPPAEPGGSEEFYELGLVLSLALFDGMALSRFHLPYEPYPTDRLLQALKDLSRLVYPRPPTPGGNP